MAVILPEGGRQVIEKTECLRISKSVLQFITLNIQGLKNKIPELTKATLDFNNHAIIMLTESRNAKESSFSDNDYLYLLGAADKHCGGVGWLIPLCYKNNLVSYQHIGFRLSTITLKLKNTYLLIIVCYMPTSSSEDSKVEEVYDQMKEIMSGFKKLYPLSRNNIIIGGDFNAKIKCTIRRGKFSNSAHLENNERGTKLELWTGSENLSITNRLVIKKTSSRFTWNGPNKISRGELDYFLIHNAKKASFIDTRIIKRFNVRSDHKPLLLKVKFGKLDTKQYSTRKKPRIFSSDELSQDIINKTNNKALNLNWHLNLKDNLDKDYEKLISNSISLSKMLSKKTKRPSIITDEISGSIRTRSIIFQDKSITNLLNYTILNKLINYKIRSEKKKRDQTILESALKKNRAMKFVYIEKREFNHLNLSLLKPDGSMTTTIDEVNEEIKRHYKDLYAGLPLSNDWEKSVKNFETFKDFTLSHILQRIKKIKKKAPGTDGMSFAHYKLASNVLPTALLQRFNTYIHKGFPSLFKEASLILLKKSGNAKLITNTRPIAILQGNYKLFTSMLLDRIRNKIKRNLDREQAGFRQRKNTITNTFILKTIMQKTTEFKIPLFIIFIDFKKAFDSIGHSYLFSTLGKMGLSLHEIKIIQDLYKDSRMLIPCLRSSPIQIFPSKGVKQGDSPSPVLFIAALQGIINNVKNDLKSSKLNGVLKIKNPDNNDFTQLFYLAYADDIAIFSTSQNTSEFLASSLEKHSKKAGLQLNRLKTETLTNSDVINPIYQVTQQYKYLGQWLSFSKNHENLEISTRIRNSEIACKKVMPLMERTNSIKKKAFLYVQNIRPILTYGIETLNFTKASLQRIVNAEKRILRRCLKLKIGTTETEKNERRVKVTQLLEFCGDIHDFVSQKGENCWRKL